MSLFKDFTPVSHKEWLEKINNDLKGKKFSETLVWKTDEGIDVQPFYNSESLSENISQSFNFSTKNSDWEIREQIITNSPEKANQQALKALKGGANSIEFIGEITNKHTIEKLLNNIQLDVIAIHFYSTTPLQTMELFNNYLQSNNIDKSKLNGSISYDYLGESIIIGKKIDQEVFSKIASLQNEPSFKTITVNGHYYTNAGATSTQEIAYTLSQAVEYISQLSALGISPKNIIRNIVFKLGTGSNYFFEIAKIRAFKILWQLITKEYKIDNPETYIHCQTTTYNIAAQDAQTNILRTTTEGMSAIIGGCNSLSITPFNFSYEHPTDFSYRVARNTQIILKEEAYLNKVNDPSKGSYYIENLTDEIVLKSLSLFKEIEANGGFLANINNGHIQESIHKVNFKKESDYANGKKSLLGVNIHLNTMEDTPASIIKENHSYEEILQLNQVNIPLTLSKKVANV